MKCVMCNRPMSAAAVYIADKPVGPVCARRAGLVDLARRKQGALRLGPARRVVPRQPAPENLELLTEDEHG